MPEINGKQVTFHASQRADVWWPIFPKLSELINAVAEGGSDEQRGIALFQQTDFAFMCQFLGAMIESWEFDGDPADPEAIGALDLLPELIPMFWAAVKQVTGKFASLGEAGRGSSSDLTSEAPSPGPTGASG